MSEMERKKPQRLGSIDAARGFAMFINIGGKELMIGLAYLINHQGFIDLMNSQMRHMPWHGINFCDAGLPFFLLLSGMTFPMSYEKNIRNGVPQSKIYWMILKRALTMVFLGLIYNGLLKDFSFSGVRIFSVLARLGVAWAIAAVICMHIKRDWQWIFWFIAPLLVHWLIMASMTAPDAVGYDRFSMEGNIAGYIDRTLFPGHIYNQYYDPEGLLGFIPSVSTALLGMMTGKFVMDKERNLSNGRKALYIFLAGVVLFGIGLLWGKVYPVNKRLWTGSFVCASGGIALFKFVFFYVIVDVLGKAKWVLPFTVLGVNSIAAYLAHRFLDLSHTSQYLFGWLYAITPDHWTMFLDYFVPISIMWTAFAYLYKKKVYIKI